MAAIKMDTRVSAIFKERKTNLQSAAELNTAQSARHSAITENESQHM